MSPSPRHLPHHVYPYEMIGNTLVVRPRGDAVGFALHDVRLEMGEVKQLAADPRVRHLIIDLSAERYYGSMVLGDLIEFGRVVRLRGGRIGLAGASSDLEAVLKLMHLDEQWEFFPTTEAGLQAIAVIPFRQRVWRHRVAVGWLLAAVAIGVVIAFWPSTDRGPEYYAKISELWTKYEQRSSLSDVERDMLRQQVRKKLEPIVADLSRRGDRQRLTPVEQCLLFATRPWLEALDLPDAQAKRRYEDIRTNLDVAGDLIAHRPPALDPLPLAAIPATAETALLPAAAESGSSPVP